MYASITEIKFKPGKVGEAMALAGSRRPELGQVDELKQVTVVDKGNDLLLIVGQYESQAQQEVAGSSFQETLRLWGDLVEGTPTRAGGAVLSNDVY